LTTYREVIIAAANMVAQSSAWVRSRDTSVGEAVRISAKFAMLMAVLLAGGCSMPDTDSYRLPAASNLFRPMSVTNYRERTLPPVTAADLVDANGNCAGAPVAAVSGDPAAQAGASPGGAAIPGPVALGMTECEVVRNAGVPARADVGANERRERTATLTYVGGERSGIYLFTDGRLKSMELGPEPPQPEKASAKNKKKPAKPPARRAAQPNQISVQ
jgi:hypothetical protein